ncbi:hypothetical protein ACFYYL_24515 [Actinomadura geliboluensis]|uniref:hypothetical protein n=1 Tax=Actinomadura geliboluensis TaxID=882440 RepID=UPI0036AB3317
MEPSSGHRFSPEIAYFDLTAEYSSLEGWGIQIVNFMGARLRTALIDPADKDACNRLLSGPIPEGPHFVYESSLNLFHTRRGRGPLFIAWDTNILIDYFKYGRALWEGSELPSLPEEYYAELEGIQLLIALWVMRDIRFIILPGTIKDAKKRLPAERRAQRVRAFREFTSALSLVSSGPSRIDSPSREGLLVLPDSLLEDAATNVPQGFDRILVTSAARMGIHVFMTMDKGILKQRETFRSFGLLLASPLDIFEHLLVCGAFHCMLAPRYAHWPLPDQMRVGHLIRALPEF